MNKRFLKIAKTLIVILIALTVVEIVFNVVELTNHQLMFSVFLRQTVFFGFGLVLGGLALFVIGQGEAQDQEEHELKDQIKRQDQVDDNIDSKFEGED